MNIVKSLAMQQKAKVRIPGMTQLLSKRPDMFSLEVWPGYFSKAKGVEVWDLDGNCYIDMSIGGIGANVLGYSDPDVNAAVIEAVQAGSSCSLNCPEEVELAELLCELHPWAEMVRFTRTGGESMAVAVRIARAYTGKDKIAFCGYHGWHDWYLAANLGTENALGEHLLPGLSPRGVPAGLKGTVLPFRYNVIDDLKNIVGQNRMEIAAIVMEPIRSTQPIRGFLENVRDLSSSIGAVLIMDEISAGFRLNSGGAHLKLMVEPDIAVFSKAIGNGFPIGAIIGRRQVMEAAQETFISSTCWTERTGPAAALATIKKHIAVNASIHLVALGERIQAGWRKIGEKNGLSLEIGGIPPLSHFTFDHHQAPMLKALFIQMMLEKGFLASNQFYSMYAHSDKHIDEYLKSMNDCFAEISKALSMNNVKEQMRGRPSTSGFRRLA